MLEAPLIFVLLILLKKILNLIGYISNESLVKNFDKDELNLNDYSKFGLSIPVIQGSSYPFLGKPVSADHM